MAHSTRPTGTRVRNLWVPAALFAFAVVLAFGPFPYASVVMPPVPVPTWATDTTPIRQPRLRPEYATGGYQYRCSECHKIIPSPAETSRTLTQHREIQLEHGINTRCFNCHHRTNRDAFVDDYGREIPWDQPQILCGKCHGPVYRDWQHGAHGRSNGYWDKSRGTQTRRRCIECHDPHCPPFSPLAPAPGPNTLRMGPQGPGTGHEDHDPLRLGRHADAGGIASAAEEKN
ncbi:MAG: hypothetical protein ACYC3X_11905 [Pirellulaceae bacterium]